MRSKIFKSVIILFMAFGAISNICFAQQSNASSTDSITKTATSTAVTVDPMVSIDPVKVDLKQVKVKLSKLNVDLKELNASTNARVNVALNNLTADLNADLKDIGPQINMAFKDGADISINSDDKEDDDVNLVKNYSKTYSVDGNDALSVSNKYGKVIVNTWARNEIKVDVQIKIGAGSQDVAQKLLDNVTISDSKNGNNINFSTTIGEVKDSWFSMFHGDGNHSMEINYTVYMPAKNDLTIDDRYGAIVVPNMDAKVTINSGYGSFKGGILSKESDIRVKYGNADIESVNTCAIDVGYGNLNLGSANKIDANISYSGVKIGRLRESGAINIKYGGGVDVANVDKSVRNLAVNASYTNVNLGLSNDENANFAIVTRYGDFNFDGHDVTISEKTPDDDGRPHFTKSYKGYLGKSGSDKNITVNVSYGNVKFQ
jgi:hypothetical protein